MKNIRFWPTKLAEKYLRAKKFRKLDRVRRRKLKQKVT